MRVRRKLLISMLFVIVMTVLFTVPTFAKPKLNKKTVTITPKQIVKLTVTGTKKKPKWSSSNKKIASVSKTGEVTGLKPGSVVIKAKVKGKTLKCRVTVNASPSNAKLLTSTGSVSSVQEYGGRVTFRFMQKGWYVARLEVQVWDKQKQHFVWLYSDSCAIDETAKLSLDTNRYEVNRVGYQIWFFGWNNDYMNIPWANTDYATTFILSGSGDYPEFSWQ